MEPVEATQTDYEPHPLTDEGFNASAGALDELTTMAEVWKLTYVHNAIAELILY